MTSRSGLVALIGAPNAGKSTLFNRLLGARLSIATPKAQTTRLRIHGVILQPTEAGGSAEIVLMDLPGIFRPRRRLDRAMLAAAWRGAAESDVALLIVDARTASTATAGPIAQRLVEVAREPWLVLNKIDLVARPSLLPLAAALNARHPFRRTFMVSATSGDGTADLLAALAPAMPEGPHLYPADQVSNLSERWLAAEFVREQVFLQSHDEVPYDSTVETESWEERKDGSVRISAVITVAREGQKAILIGAGGARVRAIGMRARALIAQSLGRPVHLSLRVETAAGWDEDRRRLTTLGLEDP
jgi:GTP-binding protein Era